MKVNIEAKFETLMKDKFLDFIHVYMKDYI